MAGLGEAVFGKSQAASIPAPTPQPVVRMPDRKDPAVLEAGRRKRRDLETSGGRESTNLTGSGVTPPYTNTELGQ